MDWTRPLICAVTTRPGPGVITEYVYHCATGYQFAHLFCVIALSVLVLGVVVRLRR